MCLWSETTTDEQHFQFIRAKSPNVIIIVISRDYSHEFQSAVCSQGDREGRKAYIDKLECPLGIPYLCDF